MKRIATLAVAGSLLASAATFGAQAKPAAPAPAAQGKTVPPAQAAAAITPPADYVIGVGDVLAINFWEEPNFSTDSALVRPDGRITLPLINDIDALGLRTDQLQVKLTDLGTKLGGLKEPRVTVTIRAINSRKVYVLGGVNKTGEIPLVTPMNVLQAITLAGGPKEFVSGEKIKIIRTEGGKQRAIPFNLKEVQQGLKLDQNIPLIPGDIINVPE